MAHLSWNFLSEKMCRTCSFGDKARTRGRRSFPGFWWLLYCSLWLSHAGFSQVTFENAFPSLAFEFTTEIQNTGVFGDDRLFVVGQQGAIQVFDNDAATSTTSQFLDITSDVLFNTGQELGLLGLAFHPDYETNGFFYLYYTRAAASGIEIVLERFRVDPNDPNKAEKSSRLPIFRTVKNQSTSNHNGGKIAFGPDGYLYVSIGDGGGGGDPNGNAQNVNVYFGSILRLDVDVDGSNPVDANGIAPEGLYEIPTDNPLVDREGLDEIYAWGIRNTWKMSFDLPTGRLWGGDVGQNAFEEVNLIEPGNYGWNRFEGESVFDNTVPDPGNTIPPVFSYDRSSGDRSVTGGYVYRGAQVTSTSPSIVGKYIFGDFVSGRVWVLDYNSTTNEASRTLLFEAREGSSISVSTFGLDINGEMYFAGYGSSGSIYRLKDGTTTEDAVAVAGVGSWEDELGDVDGEINAIVTAEDAVYIGGNFTRVGTSVAASRIAKWTASEGWQSLGEGTDGVVNALALGADGSLYVGGSFTTVGTTAARNVARYTDQSGWEPLSDGVSGAVLAMTTDGNTLYVGGVFAQAGGTAVNNVARWDGGWSALEDADTQQAGTNNEVRSMAVDEAGNLYVGGNFGSAGGNSASRIAQWDGSKWSGLGGGTSGFVQAILVTEDYVYAGGNFTIAGDQTVNRVARWNRSSQTWSSLNNGLSNSVNALTADDRFIYVGGQFSNALNAGSEDNIIVNGVVRWSEETGWEALGEGTNVGVDNFVNTLRFDSATLFAGGRFGTAGAAGVQNLATWSSAALTASVPLEADTITLQQPDKDTWQTVNLSSTFADPIVIVSPVSSNGSDPTTVRVRNVDSRSFEVQLDEWDYLDGQHVAERLSYLVVEAGSYTLAGLPVEAGKLTVDENFTEQAFTQSFSASPVVLVQCASYNDPAAVAPRVQNVSEGGFEVRLQEEEKADDLHAEESLHYIALAPGTGNEAGWSLEAALSSKSFTHQWEEVDFGSNNPNTLLWATMQSYVGRNSATLRYRPDATGASLKVEEEQSEDSEVIHLEESVAYLVLSERQGEASRQTNVSAPKSTTALATAAEGLRLHPNPVQIGDAVVIKTPAAEPGQLTIHNAQGKLMFEAEPVDQQRLATGGWQPGLYFVRWHSRRGVRTQKLLLVE